MSAAREQKTPTVDEARRMLADAEAAFDKARRAWLAAVRVVVDAERARARQEEEHTAVAREVASPRRTHVSD